VTTDTVAEDSDVATIGFVFARRATSTSYGEEGVAGGLPTTHRPSGSSDFWGVFTHTTAARKRPIDVESALVAFAESTLGVPDVIAVTYAKERHSNLVWTFIRQRDRAVRREIYLRERALMTQYPELIFDFNVVALDQSAVGTLVPDDLQGRVVMYRPRE